jgi:xylulokinase
MSYLLGLDLGTSSVKCLLADGGGGVRAVAEREYPILAPNPGWAEQEPETWWQMSVEAIQEVLARAEVQASAVRAVGLSGQMHGTVFLGNGGRVLCPAIIWPDQRSLEQCQQVYLKIGHKKLAEIAGSGVFTGFMLASLLWTKQNEVRTWDRLRYVLFPKDYIGFRLTGELATDITDASGGLLVDIKRRTWSEELVSKLGIPTEILPPILESHEIVGAVTPKAANATRLAPGTPVVAGAADQATGALGSGTIAPGVVSAAIGSGGQLVTSLRVPQTDGLLRVHTYCHALPGTWYLLGATLAAGLSFRWLRDAVLQESGPLAYERMTALAAEAPVGSGGLLFLPYLTGERTIHGEMRSRGIFFGLTMSHNRANLIRAVMEGVVFSLRRVLGVFRELGIQPKRVVTMGGGARSALWCQIMADVLQTPVVRLEVEEQSAVGAAILAGLGAGVYPKADAACATFVRYRAPLEPQHEASAVYQQLFDLFCSAHLRAESDFAILNRL